MASSLSHKVLTRPDLKLHCENPLNTYILIHFHFFLVIQLIKHFTGTFNILSKRSQDSAYSILGKRLYFFLENRSTRAFNRDGFNDLKIARNIPAFHYHISDHTNSNL